MAINDSYLLRGFNFKVELSTEDLDLISNIQEWCQQSFNNDWALSYPQIDISVWYFIREEDVTMFMLKWL